MSAPPPRKKSKWDKEDEQDRAAAELDRKRAAVAARLAREKDLAGREPASSRGSSAALASPLRNGAADGGSDAGSAGGSRRVTPGQPVPRARRPKRGRAAHPLLDSCRSVYSYERLNEIEEGSYGIVFRARCKSTGDIVALKKLKMDKEKNGFPITSLREIQTLMSVPHENIVRVREVVVGDTLTQVFIVMDFVEHDLKTLLANMPTPFLASEIKTLMLQLLSAMAACHDNWIIHRDLKTSNLLMNNRGQIKVADFGLARTYGDPLGDMTQLVVTLWYRAPELLFGATEYTTAVDIWSIGCIFGELILREPLLPGRGEIDQVNKIFKLLGRPTDEMWPGSRKLPNAKSFNVDAAQPYSSLSRTFRYLTQAGLDLIQKLLTYDPEKRITAEEALRHPYFTESPLPKDASLFNSFPSIANGEKKTTLASPSAPERAAGGYDFV
ncbi:putative Cyclin-dependent kinase [Rhodotorula taiwanensis]|uniref:cyclin-dependent kinase n=1 Tax=Rhodotorula taiwanensis TaxID=741276 RepID=A0A2S5B2J8_9BASI|nr:putative Cyclin-dependent kinase [Rhodotorula taiwanensis]